MKKYHNISSLEFTDTMMLLEVDGKKHEFIISEISERLHNASIEERNHFKYSPSGYGIHWPMIDEDLSVDGLLSIINTPDSQRLSA